MTTTKLPAKAEKAIARIALEHCRVETLEERRSDRLDFHDVAVWTTGEPPPWTVAELQAQLERPQFCLYLGRKCCPPALPLRPQVLSAATLREAFAKAVFPDGELLLPVLKEARLVQVYWDESLKDEHGYTKVHLVTRRDDPLDRERWQFLERQECYATETGENPACA